MYIVVPLMETWPAPRRKLVLNASKLTSAKKFLPPSSVLNDHLKREYLKMKSEDGVTYQFEPLFLSISEEALEEIMSEIRRKLGNNISSLGSIIPLSLSACGLPCAVLGAKKLEQ